MNGSTDVVFSPGHALLAQEGENLLPPCRGADALQRPLPPLRPKRAAPGAKPERCPGPCTTQAT